MWHSGSGRRGLLTGTLVGLGAALTGPVAAETLVTEQVARRGDERPATPAFSAGRVKIQFFGDSLAQGLFLTTNPLLRRRDELRLLNGTRHATGLTRSDEHDWPATIRASLAREPAHVVLVWIGANDFRPFVDRAARARHQFGTQTFFEAYRQSVATISQAAAECGAALGWIGLPNMRDDRFAAAVARLNTVMQEGAESEGGVFIPTWAATSDAAGRFRASVATADRAERRLRADDGVHFSDIGYRLMARLAFDQLATHSPGVAAPLHMAVDAVVV